MNQTQKIIKYIAVAFAVSLIVAIISGIYNLGLSLFGVIGHNSKNMKTIDDFPSNSTVLYINIGSAKVNIKSGPNLKVENNNKYVNVYQNNNTLFITEKSHRASKKGDIVVYIPENINYDFVEISTGASNMEIEALNAKKVEFETGAGKLVINNVLLF